MIRKGQIRHKNEKKKGGFLMEFKSQFFPSNKQKISRNKLILDNISLHTIRLFFLDKE